MKSSFFWALVSICCVVQFFSDVQVLAQDSSILPAQSGFRLFDKRQFGIGVFNENITNRTAETYEQEGLGFAVSYDQWVRSYWSGGLQLRLGSWQLTDKGRKRFDKEGKVLDLVSPWTIGTRIHFSPDLLAEITDGKSSWLHQFVRPALGFGAGFASFFDSRSFLARKSKNENSEPFVSYACGLRFLWPKNAALKISYEWWRGVKTYNYTSEMWMFEVQFGDVDAI
jgi:hypothetical protein